MNDQHKNASNAPATTIKSFNCKDSDTVLAQAAGEYAEVVVLGWDKQEPLHIRADTTLKPIEVLWVLDQFKRKLLAGTYSDAD